MGRNSGLTIKKKIFLSIYLLILFLTLLVDGLVFFVYKQDIESKIAAYGNQTIDEMALHVSRNFLSAEESITYKLNASGMLEKHASSSVDLEYGKEMKTFVSLVENSGMKVKSCYLQRVDQSEEFWSDGSIKREEYKSSAIGEFLQKDMQEMNQNRGTVLWRRFDGIENSIFMIKNVVDGQSLQKLGVLCIQIDKAYFHSFENEDTLSIMIDDERGGLLYNSENVEAALPNIRSGKSQAYLMMTEQVAKKNWTLTGLIDRNQALNNLRHLMLMLLMIEIVFFFVSFFIANRVSENMTWNIDALIRGMKRLERGQEMEFVQAKTKDETAYLVETFNNMNQKLRETMSELLVQQTQKEKAEYNALIAQLNPHFLYNSLESISSMAKLNNQREIVDAIGNLSKLLRICLSGNEAEICVKDELNYIVQYLSLEHLITGGQVEWDIDCPREFDNHKVPKLILQPLVENCMVHGFSNYEGIAMIVIIVHQESDRLILEVSDNGNGMTQEYANQLLACEEIRKSIEDRRHIGIKSIQQRIKYLYGEAYGIEIRAEEQVGTTVKITLPVVKGR